MKNVYAVRFKREYWAGVDVVASSEEEAKKIAQKLFDDESIRVDFDDDDENYSTFELVDADENNSDVDPADYPEEEAV